VAPDRGRAAAHRQQRLDGDRADAREEGAVTELPFHRERPEASVATPLSLAALREFDDVIDARSPAEFAEDHLPGAINAPTLEGGYKAVRRQVVADLAEMPARFRFLVVCGATGSGKSRLLEALAAEGAQVLDLEMLAQHRGSVLGEIPDAPQPTQKSFETAL